MKIIKDYPPNYSELKRFFPLDLPDYVPVFPWGDVLYNPSGNEISPDLMFHEEIHSKQQGDYPEIWWQRYCSDSQFRLEQEVEAYAGQLNFVKRALGSKIAKEFLGCFAKDLSSPLYQLKITYFQAETLIRCHSKK